MKALTADGSKWCALSIDNHSLAGEKKSTCWIAGGNFSTLR